MRLLVCTPPARLSHEFDTLGRMPNVELAVLSDREIWPVEHVVTRPARRLPYVGSYQRWTSALAWYRDLDTVDPGDVDAVLSFELFSATSAQTIGLARRLGVPHLAWVAANRHDHPIYRLPPWRSYTRRIISNLDGAICTSGLAVEHAVKLGLSRNRTRMVRPGVDCALFSPRVGGLQPKPKVVFVGELRPDKGIDDIVGACDHLIDRTVELELTIIGDGELSAKVKGLASGRPWMTVTGRLPRHDVAARMRDARVLVLGSRRTWWEFEQMPFTLMEALASGNAIVATRCGGNLEVVPSWNALVPQRDCKAMAAAIEQALSPDADAWSLPNRNTALEQFETGLQSQRFAEAIRSILEAPEESRTAIKR